MGQVTSGARAVLSHPLVYSAFQFMMGGRGARRALIRDHIRPESGMTVLDIGCGPAGILESLPGVEYWGFDASSTYIDAARARFGSRGRFFCQNCGLLELAGLPRFDVVLAMGLIHHLDNLDAFALFQLAKQAAKPGGRFVTIDPCLEPGQNPVARFIIRKDRGQHVRTQQEYRTLAETMCRDPIVRVHHTLWVPYTHCIMECRAS